MSFTQKILQFQFTLAQGSFAGSGSGANTLTLPILRSTIKVVKAGGDSFNQMQASVWGMTASHMNQLSTLGVKIQQVPTNTVTVLAGNSLDGLAILFQGTVYDAYADLQAQPEVAFRIACQTALAELITPVPSTSYKGSTDVTTVMAGLAKQMNLAFENNGVSVIIPNQYYSGSAAIQAQQAANDAGISWIIENGKMAIWPKNGTRAAAGTGIPIISYKNGTMIGYPAFTAQGVMVRCVYNAAIKFGAKVQIESTIPQANGVWTVRSDELDLDCQVPNGKWQQTLKIYNPDFPEPVVR